MKLADAIRRYLESIYPINPNDWSGEYDLRYRHEIIKFTRHGIQFQLTVEPHEVIAYTLHTTNRTTFPIADPALLENLRKYIEYQSGEGIDEEGGSVIREYY